MRPRIIETVDYFPPFGTLGGPGEEPWVLAIMVDTVLGGNRDKDLLMIVQPKSSTVGVELGVYGPLGEMDWPGDDGSWGWTGDPVTIYLAATTGRASANDDTPAKTYVPGKLRPFNFGVRLFEGVDPLSRSRPGQGVITLDDPNHELDYLLTYIWDSTPIILNRGKRGTYFNTWETIGRFRSAGLLFDVDTKTFRLRDLGWQLSGPLHEELYQGTGGLEGDASLKGKFKPWALGYCFNIEPVLISASSQIFQFSLSSAQAVTALRHGGVPLTFDADYPDFAALAAATIASGKYATCLAESLVRPNVTLQFSIRLDVTGDADTVNGHPAPLTRASIVRRIATARGPNHIDDGTEVDAAAFTAMEASHSAPVGWYFDEVISKADAIDRALGGILGWWRVRPDGRFTVGWVEDPAILSPIATIKYTFEGMGRPRMVDTAPPRAATLISYKTNYGPEPRANLAGSVTDANAAIYGQAARYGQAASTTVQNAYPTAPKVVIDEAGFRDEADATTEATRQQTIFEHERRRWEWEMEADPFVDLIGGCAALVDANIVGLGSSINLLCVGINTPGTNASTFEFFA